MMTNQYKSNIKLFQKAFIEQIIEEVEEYAKLNNECLESLPKASNEIVTTVLPSTGSVHSQPIGKQRKRFVRLIVAVLIILLSVSFIYARRYEIAKLVEEIHDRFVTIVYNTRGETGVNTIDEIYLPTYIPEDFTLTKSNTYLTVIYHQWENNDNARIVFQQRTIISTESIVDIDINEYKQTIIDNHIIYYTESETHRFYIWYSSDYIFSLDTENVLYNIDIAIIESITQHFESN